MSVLVVDGDQPAVASLTDLLSADQRVGAVRSAGDVPGALRLVRRHAIDAAFLDATVPDLNGLELGTLLTRLTPPPALVYLAADGRYALGAFDVGALDYLLKPVSPERLGRALDRVTAWRFPQNARGDDLRVLPVEVGGRTVFVRRDDVCLVAARGDYVRLHTRRGTHLVRLPLSRFAERWEPAGFVRVHRSYLVSSRHVRELREHPSGGVTVQIADGTITHDVPVSRRHLRTVKELIRAAQRTL
jgi:two-component system, LytTR family, response regulator